MRYVRSSAGSLNLPAGVAAVCLLAGLLLGMSAEAQEPGRVPEARSPIRVEVSLVTLLASVLDAGGRPAVDLTRDQFEIYEEGRRQEIQVFEAETEQPLDLALLLDTSLSMHGELRFAAEAAGRFLRQVARRGDRVAVFEISDAVSQLTALSGDLGRAEAALRRVRPGDGTSLYDAIYLASQSLERAGTNRRRVLVLLTDGGETTSRADFETARRAAVRAEALLYTILFQPVRSESGRNTAGEHALVTIAETTGGAIYHAEAPAELGSMFDRIGKELRTQYRLGYYPQPRPPQGLYRRIEVRVKGAYTVRSRTLYYSGGPAE